MARVERLSFITKYLVAITAMTIVPNNIMSFLVNTNNSSILTFQEEKDAKERIPEGM